MTVPSDIIPYLRTVPPFDQLSYEALAQTARELQITYHVNGDVIQPTTHPHFDNAQVDELYLVRAGAVVLKQLDGSVLEQRGEGEIFGHIIHFDGLSHAYQAQAIEDTLLWHIPAARIERLCQDYPRFKQMLAAPPGERLHAEGGGASIIRCIGDLPLRPPITIGPNASVRECAQWMNQHRVSSLPVVEQGQLQGILTDRDLRARVVAPGLDLQTPVTAVMSPHPVTVDTQKSVEDGLVVLLRHGIHHLPVLDVNGALCGVVSAGDLLRVHSPHPLRLVRDISRADQRAEVATLARQGPEILGRLVGELKDVSQIGRIAGLITDACTRRLLELGEQELGAPPMPYAWLAFGSQARLEQGLVSDQDNGMLLAREPDTDEASYFARLSQWVCDGLADCGYTYCNGGIMAMGEWRMSLERWQSTFAGWIREPDPKSVMHTSIFFDMRPIHGALDLAEELHQRVLQQASQNRIFLRFLAAESMTHRPPLGFFRQFVQERGGNQSQGLNLKQRGVIPVVDLARVLALEGALSEVHTEERLLAASANNLITPGDAANLIQATRFIARVRLEHQTRQVSTGQKPDHLVDPAMLSALHRRYLRSAFSVVRSAQQALAQRFLL